MAIKTEREGPENRLGLFLQPIHMEFGPWSLHGALDILAVCSVKIKDDLLYLCHQKTGCPGNIVNTSAGFPHI